MKLFGIFVVVCLVCELNALPSPLQAFTGGDQTTGSKWPPFQNAGLDYWSLKAQNIDLGEHNVDDGKDIVKKGVEAEQQPQPVVQQEIEEPHGGPTAGTPLEGTVVQQQPAAKPTSPVLQNYPFNPASRGLYAYINGRQYLLQNYYPQFAF